MEDSIQHSESPAARTVLVCETQPLMVEGLRYLFSFRPGFMVVGSAPSFDSFLDLVHSHRSDLMIIDKAFGISPILEFLEAVGRCPPVPVTVVWGVSFSEMEVLSLLQSGVAGVIRKTADVDLISSCLRTVAEGGVWVETSLFSKTSHLGARYSRLELTERELQVMELLERGLRNKEIASRLGIQLNTVKIHVRNIFDKTGLRGRYDLALAGLKDKGLLNDVD